MACGEKCRCVILRAMPLPVRLVTEVFAVVPLRGDYPINATRELIVSNFLFVLKRRVRNSQKYGK